MHPAAAELLPRKGLPIRVLREIGLRVHRYRWAAAAFVLGSVAWAVWTMHPPFSRFAHDLLFELLCLAVVLAGVALRLAAVGFHDPRPSRLGGGAAYAPPLYRTGVYSLVRNPRALGGILAAAGVTAVLQSPTVMGLNVLLLFFYFLPRIRDVEDRMALAYWGRYFHYAERVPRLLPRPGARWTPSKARFDLGRALRLDGPKSFGALAAFSLLAGLRELWFLERYEAGQAAMIAVWAAAAAVAAGACLGTAITGRSARAEEHGFRR